MPVCGHEGMPIFVKNRLSTGGWVFFAVMLSAAFRFAGCPSSSTDAKKRSGSVHNAVSGELDTPHRSLCRPGRVHLLSGVERSVDRPWQDSSVHSEGCDRHSLSHDGRVQEFVALCRGELVQSFLYNPLMLVYLLLSSIPWQFCFTSGLTESGLCFVCDCMDVECFSADWLGGKVCAGKAILVSSMAGCAGPRLLRPGSGLAPDSALQSFYAAYL